MCSESLHECYSWLAIISFISVMSCVVGCMHGATNVVITEGLIYIIHKI